MAEESDEFGRPVVQPHRWWDRRMGILDNLRFGFILPALCLVRGHRFDWLEVIDGPDGPVASLFGTCERCANTADRARLPDNPDDG